MHPQAVPLPDPLPPPVPPAARQAYSACEQGEDASAVLGPIVRARALEGLVPAKALEHPDPKQALRVRAGGCVRGACALSCVRL